MRNNADADPLSVTAPAHLMRRQPEKSPLRDEKLETNRCNQSFRITVEDVEVVKEPFSVTFKFAVHRAIGEHSLCKSYSDLEHLGGALTEELPTEALPRLPRPHAQEQLADRGFRARLGAYLFCLSCNQNVRESFAFNHFFQLAQEDAQERHQQVRSASKENKAARVGQALFAEALGSLGRDSSQLDGHPETKAASGSFPPTRGRYLSPPGAIQSSGTSFPPTRGGHFVPTGSVESSGRALSSTVLAAPAFRSLPPAYSQGMGQRHRAHTSSGRVPLQGVGEMEGPLSAASPFTISVSMARRPEEQLEREQTGSEAPLPGRLLNANPRLEREQTGSEAPLPGCLHANPRQDSLVTSTAHASAQEQLESRAPEKPTSQSESSAPAAVRRAGKKRTPRIRALCVVCLEKPQEMAIDPCGHMSMCEECMTSVKDCPICRGPIHKAMKIIIAKRHQSGETSEYC